jgi:hypothetical protein
VIFSPSCLRSSAGVDCPIDMSSDMVHLPVIDGGAFVSPGDGGPA